MMFVPADDGDCDDDDDDGDDDNMIDLLLAELDVITFASAAPDLSIADTFSDGLSALSFSSSMFDSSSSFVSSLSLFVGFPFIPFNAFGLKRWKLWNDWVPWVYYDQTYERDTESKVWIS